MPGCRTGGREAEGSSSWDRESRPRRSILGGPRAGCQSGTATPGRPAPLNAVSNRLQELHEVRLVRRAQPQSEEAVVVVDDGGQRREAPVVVEAALLVGEEAVEG